MSPKELEFVNAATKMYGEEAVLDRSNIQSVIDQNQLGYPYWFVQRDEFRIDRGKYKLPSIDGSSQTLLEGATAAPNNTVVELIPGPFTSSAPVVPAPTINVDPTQYVRMTKLVDESQPTVPEKYPGYIPFGFFNDMKQIFLSQKFMPIMVTGVSGNGKTLMVEQAAAVTGRKLIRVNVSIETDQTDLLGGSELVNGNTVKRDGPVLLAMRYGAILLLDEIDRGSNKLMCLQSILEGKPYFDKLTGETVYPKNGFQIVATANTKGKGSEDGRYLAQILDDAFLERFPITVDQDFPIEKTEMKIITSILDAANHSDDDFAKKLVTWTRMIRKLYDDQGGGELISTRRLVDICKTFVIFGDRMKAITLCTNRFDTESQNGFLEAYTKIDETVNVQSNEPDNTVSDIWLQEVQNAEPNV